MNEDSKPASVVIWNEKEWEALTIQPISPMHCALKAEFGHGESMIKSTKTLKELTYHGQIQIQHLSLVGGQRIKFMGIQ